MGNHDDYDAAAFREESAKLADVIAHIQDESVRMQTQDPAAAHREASAAIQSILHDNADTLRSALAQPYFGRLDYFHTKDSEDMVEAGTPQDPPQTIYLGVAHIAGKDIFTWTARVGKLWYTQSYEDGYTAPKGYVRTRVDLKRYLKIRDSALQDVNDIFRRRLPAPETDRDDVLIDVLSSAGSADPHLQVIVETIEPDQYERIANVDDKVLIVQGAAGSGKSEIGLHRIAYLLSPFNGIHPRQRPTPETTLFVGPSQAFLEYAADILPALGIHRGVEQVRFADWQRARFSQPPRVQRRIWNSLIAPGDTVRFDAEAETFKGTLAMADVLGRHVSEVARSLRKRLLTAEPPSDLESGARLTPPDIHRAVSDTLPRGATDSLNTRRAAFVDRVADLLWASTQKDRRRPAFDMFGIRDELRTRTAKPWCDQLWKHLDFREEYIGLLRTAPKSMSRLARGALPAETAECLARSAEQVDARGSFDDSDVGALAHPGSTT